jgi:protein gp37
MSENSKIEWTDNTFNPWIGCSKVSPGCKNCYAEADMDNRRKRVVWGVNGTRSVTSYGYWRQPVLWNRAAEEAGERKRVFCASLADVFEDWKGHVVDSKQKKLLFPVYETFDDIPDMRFNTGYGVGVISLPAHDCDDVPAFSHYTEEYVEKHYSHDYGNDELNAKSAKMKTMFKPLTIETIRAELFLLIERTPNLYWLLLTKRIENVMDMVPEHWRKQFPSNVWIGTSVEDQEQAGIRILELLKIPATVRFLSCEPQLQRLDLSAYLPYGVNWVIQGGESGHNKRTFDIDWAYFMKSQCELYGVPYFFKQIDKKQPIPEELLIRNFPAI